jgi:hypothetical protein
MDENSRSNNPVDARVVTREAMVQSALLSAERAEEIGLPRSKIIISGKVSAVQDLIAVYSELARRSNYALHLGLTEAGMGSKGIVASSAAMGFLLQQGIGDTIRVSLTPEPNGDRTLEVKVGQELLQTIGLRTFVPLVAACPGALSRRRRSQRRGDGLHRQRTGREQARRHRHFAAGHRRSPCRACVYRWQEGDHVARSDGGGRLSEACHRLYRAAIWHG